MEPAQHLQTVNRLLAGGLAIFLRLGGSIIGVREAFRDLGVLL